MAADLLASTKNALTQLEAVFGSSPTPKPATQPSTPEPLRFGTVFAPAFEHMGCSEQAINDLRHIYDHNVGALRRTFQEAFFTSVRKLAELGAWSLPETEAALRHRYTEDYAHSHRHLAAELTAVVQAARAHADRLTASEAEQPGSFTPDVIKILTSAFDRCHTITRAERRELAQATSLDERQIATWFANQRQRRARAARASNKGAFAEMRLGTAAPYDRSGRPPPKVRDFSGSSTSSASSLASDGSTAASSIVSWISSSASSGIEYDSPSASSREWSPRPEFAHLVAPVDSPASRPVSYGEHYFSQPFYRFAAHPVPSDYTPPAPQPTVTQVAQPPAPVPTFSMTPQTPSQAPLTTFQQGLIPAQHRHSLDPVAPIPVSAHFDQLPPLSMPFSPPPMLQGFDFEAVANANPQDAAFWDYFLQPPVEDEQWNVPQGGEAVMLPVGQQDIQVQQDQQQIREQTM